MTDIRWVQDFLTINTLVNDLINDNLNLQDDLDELSNDYCLLEIKADQCDYYTSNWIFADTEALIAYSNRMDYEIVTTFNGDLSFHNNVWEYVTC